MNRRDFLKTCTLAGLSFPIFSGQANSKMAPSQNEHQKTILLIELQGGNDGLNTVVPYSDDRYYELRPNIALPKTEIITLNSQLALHHALEPLMPIWEKQQCQIMLGIGYQNPNLSHFRSIEIWNTASDSDQYLDKGWLAKTLETQSQSAIRGLVLGGQYGPLAGAEGTLQIRNVQQFLKQSRRQSIASEHLTRNPALNHLLQTQSVIDQAASRLKTQLKPLQAPSVFAKDAFSRQMALATQIIQSDLNIPAIKVRLNGFDTHANQKPIQARLLKSLASNIAKTELALLATGHWQDTRIMTYSEFGRRAKENGAKGTDHGTAAPHFILGGDIQGGLSGAQPSLNNLEKNNLKYTTDFKAFFALAQS